LTREPTNVSGNIILSPSYNPNLDLPTTEQGFCDTQDAQEGVIWKTVECKINVKTLHKMTPWKLLRAGATPGNRLEYDGMELNIATIGTADTSIIAKLWVEYDVDVAITLNQPLPGSPNILTSASVFSNAGLQGVLTGVAATVVYGAPTITNDPLDVFYNSTTFRPPAGNYKVTANTVLYDNTGEYFSVQSYLEKNGSAISPNCFVENPANAIFGAAQDVLSCSTCNIVYANGADTFIYQVYAIGAAGLLNIQANAAQIIWEVI